MSVNAAKKISLGRLVATAGVAALMDTNIDFAKHTNKSLSRYVTGDWGELYEEDRKLNDQALDNEGRIFAAYEHPEHPDWLIWIITEADRSATVVLFPSEY